MPLCQPLTAAKLSVRSPATAPAFGALSISQTVAAPARKAESDTNNVDRRNGGLDMVWASAKKDPDGTEVDAIGRHSRAGNQGFPGVQFCGLRSGLTRH